MYIVFTVCQKNYKWESCGLSNVCSIKFRSKHRTVFLLCLLQNLMEQSLPFESMRTFLTDFLIGKDTLEKRWKSLRLFPWHKKFINLINYLSVEFEGILLLPHVDRLTKKSEGLPEFFRDMIFEFGRQEMAKDTLKLM